jgi:hypothetical protein
MHKNKTFTLRTALIGAGLALTVSLTPGPSRADEGGLSFWVPGFFGSLAATPQTPGFHMHQFFIMLPWTRGPMWHSRAK